MQNNRLDLYLNTLKKFLTFSLSAFPVFTRPDPRVPIGHTKKIVMSTPVNLKDLTIENITDNVHAINSQCSDPRMKFVIERTVTHLHDLAREVRLTTNEWMTALLFLTKVGQISSDTRQVGSTRLAKILSDRLLNLGIHLTVRRSRAFAFSRLHRPPET